jgi:hypothetical protein
LRGCSNCRGWTGRWSRHGIPALVPSVRLLTFVAGNRTPVASHRTRRT